jgi:hypothetical protein
VEKELKKIAKEKEEKDTGKG